jgi:GrpB-like predicted nucleotidyltransferase (UPF0157 family)
VAASYNRVKTKAKNQEETRYNYWRKKDNNFENYYGIERGS